MPGAGILLALASALLWGTADFAGGYVSRRGHPFQILTVSAFFGIVMLTTIALVLREPMPLSIDLAWAAGAGLSGAVGIAALYRGLAVGSAAIVAPTAGVLTAAVPVAFSMLTVGWPHTTQMTGFALAVAGIWLVAGGPSAEHEKTTGLQLAFVAGAGFGGFLILIAQVPAAMVFAPLAVARVVTFAIALVLLTSRGLSMPARSVYPLAILAGVLDAGGNVLYLFARQHVRLDVAAVLSSFYPVATVALARIVLHEPVSGAQWAGAAVCLAAVGLITI